MQARSSESQAVTAPSRKCEGETAAAIREEGGGSKPSPVSTAWTSPLSSPADNFEAKLCLSRKSSRMNLVESQEPLRIAVCFFGEIQEKQGEREREWLHHITVI